MFSKDWWRQIAEEMLQTDFKKLVLQLHKKSEASGNILKRNILKTISLMPNQNRKHHSAISHNLNELKCKNSRVC